MEIYKFLAEKCKIEENSRVYIPDEPLRNFVRLVIHDQSIENFMPLGYTSGLFNGTGDVNFNSVKKFHEEICKEIKEFQKEHGNLGIYEHFGVDIKYTKKENSNYYKQKL
jgi:cytochrome c biogenesis protein ResB